MEYKYDVFISYSRRDYIDEDGNVIPGNVITKLKNRLKTEGISYWFDKEGIIHGDQFASVIVKNIKQSRLLLFVSSKSSNASEWTSDEIATARSYKRYIIPLRIDDSDYNDAVMLYLAKLDFVDYTSKSSQALDELVSSIQHYIKKTAQAELVETIHDAQKSLRQQLSVLFRIYELGKQLGYKQKQCPICETKLQLEQSFCTTCSFHFPYFYGLGEQFDDVDPVYLNKVKSLWNPMPPVEKETITENSVKRHKREKGMIEVNGVKFRMIPVEGGTFTMGEGQQGHKVTLSSYKISETPVTQALWQAVMGNNPSRYKGDDRPVEQVSWDDCQSFIVKLRELTGKHFRLPTEAEWEFAARGGNRSEWTAFSGSDNLDNVAWCAMNSNGAEEGTHDVKTKKPNELRIYDMSGNVWEWCFDRFGELSTVPETNPIGPATGDGRVCRGGGWNSNELNCELTFRNYCGHLRRDCNLGFRLAL